jgi:hypothetical protein
MITFQNTRYKTREVELPEFGNVLISTDKLNVQLLNENGSYVSEQALRIDEQIFYFVEESEIELLDTELRKLLINQIT